MKILHLFLTFLLLSFISSTLSLDKPLRLSTDGRREVIDGCTGAACTPFSSCKTWYGDQTYYAWDYYPDGNPATLQSPITTTSSSTGWGVTYFQPWPTTTSQQSISGLAWQGYSNSQIYAGQPFIIGKFGHRNFPISVYSNGNLVTEVCNNITLSIEYQIKDIVAGTSISSIISIPLNVEETPNSGCSPAYNYETVGSQNLQNPWSGYGHGSCPYGPGCTYLQSTNDNSYSECSDHDPNNSNLPFPGKYYVKCGAGCNDRVSIHSTFSSYQFTLSGNTYFLSLLGFAKNVGDTPITTFVTAENQDNYAYMYATIIQVCGSDEECQDGVSCSTGKCTSGECVYTYHDDMCTLSTDGCATGKCGYSGCSVVTSDVTCQSTLSPSATCKAGKCTNTDGYYGCVVSDIPAGCNTYSQNNGYCSTTCGNDGMCKCLCTNSGAITGHICGGCSGSGGGSTVGVYTFQVTPAVGGIFVTLTSIEIYPGSGYLTQIYINYGSTTETLTRPAGQADYVSPSFQTYGWGEWCEGCIDQHISFFVPDWTVCQPLQLAVHFSVGSITAFGGASIQNGQTVLDPRASKGTVGGSWYYTIIIEDCEACNNPTECQGEESCSTSGCSYEYDHSKCQSNIPSGCNGVCETNYQCGYVCPTTSTSSTTTTTTTIQSSTTPTSSTSTQSTTSSTSTTKPTTTSTTTTPCADPCALCGVNFHTTCDKCPYPPGFKNICVFYASQGTWTLETIPNDQVPSFFDTSYEQRWNYFAGETYVDTYGDVKVSDCYCNPIVPTTTPSPYPYPIIPIVECVRCSNTQCRAFLGYDARNVQSHNEIPITYRNPIVGVNNYFITPTGNVAYLGQPTSFIIDRVDVSVTLEFPKGEWIVWVLDGITLNVSDVAGACSQCNYPTAITTNPFITGYGVVGINYLLDTSSSVCNGETITHLILDIPECQSVFVWVEPQECLNTNGAGSGYVSYPSWDPTVENGECFYNTLQSPFAIPLVSGNVLGKCSRINITVAINQETCPNLVLGNGKISTSWTEDCGQCDTCRISNMLSIVSICTTEGCGYGSFYNEATCKCEECSEGACPPYWHLNQATCKCVQCPDDCPADQYLSPRDCCIQCPTVNCSEVCSPPQCSYGYTPTEDLCECVLCDDQIECSYGTLRDPVSGCGCVPCTTECTQGEITSSDGCGCVPYNVTVPPTTPQECPEGFDQCGVCGGSGMGCVGCDGAVGTAKWVDPCKVVCGDGSSCPTCLNDNCAVCTMAVDICGVCGGNGSGCVGCDGLPPTLTRPQTKYDQCGVCGGNGTSCLGCDGRPFSGDCPSVISVGAAAAVASLTALAAVSAIALAAILLRFRKRPELLYQAWDDAIKDHITSIAENPIYDGTEDTRNPLFNK